MKKIKLTLSQTKLRIIVTHGLPVVCAVSSPSLCTILSLFQTKLQIVITHGLPVLHDMSSTRSHLIAVPHKLHLLLSTKAPVLLLWTSLVAPNFLGRGSPQRMKRRALPTVSLQGTVGDILHALQDTVGDILPDANTYVQYRPHFPAYHLPYVVWLGHPAHTSNCKGILAGFPLTFPHTIYL